MQLNARPIALLIFLGESSIVVAKHLVLNESHSKARNYCLTSLEMMTEDLKFA